MGRRKVYDREAHAHFVTFSCYRRRRLLDDDRAKRIVLGTFNAQLPRLSAGFVVMPNHVHVVLWFAESGQLSECLKQWKRASSIRIRKLFEGSMPNYRHRAPLATVWQAKYYGFNVFSDRKLQEKLEYMHQNPVRAGLVASPCDWRWNSARYYELGQTVGIPIRWLD